MKALICCFAIIALALPASAADGLSEKLQRGLFEEEANHNLNAAIKEYESVVSQTDQQRKLIATAIFRLGECYRKLGKTNEAHGYYERIVRDYSDQEQLVKSARELLPRPSVGIAVPTNASDPVAAKLLREEISIAQQVVQTAERQASAGRGTMTDVLNARKEVLRLKRQLPENLAPAQQRVLIEEQTGIARQLLNDVEKLIAVGRLPPGDQLPAQREVLSLQRELAMVGEAAPALTGDAPVTSAMTQAETEELAQVRSLARNSPDLLNAPYRPGSTLTPLQFAAQEGFVSVIEFLLAQRVPVDGPSRGNPPLVHAAERGHLRIVELLLDRKANVNAAATDGRTALMAACDKGFKGVAELLIQRGADVSRANNKGATALHFAVVQGQDPLVEMLIERKASLDKVAEGRPNDFRWPQYGGRAAGAAPLHLAARAGFFEIVDRLLKAGAAVDITNSDSMTPLHLAMQEAKTNTSALLLSHGAKTDIPQVDGQTPLSLAIYSRDAGIVQQMISSGANVDRPAVASSRSLRYPLHLAAEMGAAHVLALLLSAKPQLEATNRPEMETPLWTALRSSNPQVTELLIKAGANFRQRHNRLSPLQYAVKTQQEDKARLLLEAGADPNEIDENGNSLLHHAVFRPPSIVALLLKHGAKPNVLNRGLETPLSITRSGGGTTAPYHESGSSRSISTEARRVEFQESAELLRSHGADEFLRRRFEITASRASTQTFGGQRTQVFSRGTNVLNNYTLFELLGSIFQNGGEGFRFPDFSNIRIRRLQGQKEVLIDVDAQEWLNTTNCARDIPLEWGDDVEIPMRVHLLGEGWSTLPPEQIRTLTQCLRRTVRVRVGNTNANVPLSPYFFTRHPGGGIPAFNTPPKFAFASLALVVQRQPEVKALLRTSTDLTRVSVLRKESNGETRQMEFDITQVGLPDVNLGNTSLSSWMHDLWLRDGDVIEIPEKP